ncbi:MAG: transcriptional regulator [Chitinophagaceae bacterium]|nr:MAG: transcriptional regulator [Chitinophagaceae bacterium]
MQKFSDPLEIQVHNLRKAALVYRAINHTLRQQMLQFLHQKQSATVTEVYVKLKLEQSVASQHLGILRRAALVSTKREGKQIFYSVNYERVKELHRLAFELLHRDED